MEILKVSSLSNPGAVAGAIANGVRNLGRVEAQVIGTRAVNQTVKAIAIARGYLASNGVDLYFIPSFTAVSIDGEERTAIRFAIRTRHPIYRRESV
ncbi:stage V sporulation protein S [Candidatus Bipolaricaulota bacterium]|nr:stage V sporulation protein S [Candidatus Bipolaricaulota bacterium]